MCSDVITIAPLTERSANLAAVLIEMIGVGVAGHRGGVATTASLKFSSAFLAVTDIVSETSII